MTRCSLLHLPVLSLFLLLILPPVLLSAGETSCDTTIRPLKGNLGYAERDGDNRCEGLYVSTVSAPNLELVSLVKGGFKFNLEPDQFLKITVPNDVKAHVQWPIKVRAVSLPLGTYYRMDARFTSDHPLIWPIDQVLLPTQLRSDQLGVYGWTGSEQDKTFIPLEVTTNGTMIESKGVTLFLRSSHEVEKIVWRLFIEGQPSSVKPKWNEALEGMVSAGQVIPIKLPLGPLVRVRVELAAKQQYSDQWATLRLHILRPGDS